MILTTEENSHSCDLETALAALFKLVKALKFYPKDHPTLASTAEKTCSDFQPLLTTHEPHLCHITREGFRLEKILIAPKNKQLKDFALLLLERRVRHLLFLPELAYSELIFFAEEMARTADDLLLAGGLAKQLIEQGIQTIWINENNLDRVYHYLLSNPVVIGHDDISTAEPETDQNETPTKPAEDDLVARIREILVLLKKPLEDDEYCQLLKELQQKAADFLKPTGLPGCLFLISRLQSQLRDSTRNVFQRQAVEDTIDQLLQPEIRRMLIDAVADSHVNASQQRALGRLLIGLKMKIAPQMLQRLYAEPDAIIRRKFLNILPHMGAILFPLLEQSLQDPQWYVVRNAVHLLGEIHREEALPFLNQAIKHPEIRVRRALIRALSSIGTAKVITLLIQLSHDSSEELRRPAVMALGRLGDSLAVTPLVKLLQQLDLPGQKTDLKVEIIHALIAIKSPQAVQPLLKLAKRFNFLHRKHIEILRAEAITALGQLGNSQLIPILDRLPRKNKSPVNRALKQALAQLRKQHHAA